MADDKYLLRDALWKMAYYSDPESDSEASPKAIRPTSPNMALNEDSYHSGLSPIPDVGETGTPPAPSTFTEFDDHTIDHSQMVVDSFYEFPTVINPHKTIIQDKGSGKSVKKPLKSLHIPKKSPSWDEVINSLETHGLYEARTAELKTSGVYFGQRPDAEASSGNYLLSVSLGLKVENMIGFKIFCII